MLKRILPAYEPRMRKSNLEISFKSGFPNSKTDFAFFWANPKTDHKPIKSTLRVGCSDQIQTWIFEINSLFFTGNDLKKVFLTSGSSNKNGTQQMPFMYDILTEPMLVAP